MAELPDFEITPRTARAPVEQLVFVCRKCAKKFPDRKFSKRLEKAAKDRRWRGVRIMETGCFDLCPKRRQVVTSPALMAQGRLMVVQPGTEPEAVLEALFGSPKP
jgi:predicted metal-binding protein